MTGAISGLDITLRRISMIENQFKMLMHTGEETTTPNSPTPKTDFQTVLDKAINNQKMPTKASKEEINELINEYSAKNNLDADFVRSVVNQESGFNSNATSRCGAMGLMQLMPSTAKGLGVVNAYDAEQNIEGGTKYLRGLMDRFDNKKELALAAYNAGPNAVKKYGGIPPYKETQNYVKNIMSAYNRTKGAV